MAALSKKPVDLFSDLLLHKMGPDLADGIVQGQAHGNEFRTTPLWGVSVRRFLLHERLWGNHDKGYGKSDTEHAQSSEPGRLKQREHKGGE